MQKSQMQKRLPIVGSGSTCSFEIATIPLETFNCQKRNRTKGTEREERELINEEGVVKMLQQWRCRSCQRKHQMVDVEAREAFVVLAVCFAVALNEAQKRRAMLAVAKPFCLGKQSSTSSVCGLRDCEKTSSVCGLRDCEKQWSWSQLAVMAPSSQQSNKPTFFRAVQSSIESSPIIH